MRVIANIRRNANDDIVINNFFLLNIIDNKLLKSILIEPISSVKSLLKFVKFSEVELLIEFY